MKILELRFDIPSLAEKMIPAVYDQTRAKVESALESMEKERGLRVTGGHRGPRSPT